MFYFSSFILFWEPISHRNGILLNDNRSLCYILLSVLFTSCVQKFRCQEHQKSGIKLSKIQLSKVQMSSSLNNYYQARFFGLNSPGANVPALAKHGCKKKVLAKRKEKK